MNPRKELEGQILAQADYLRADTAGMSIIPLERLEPYVEAWHSLSLYYRDHAEEDISVFVVGEYLNWSLHLGTITYRTQDLDYKAELEDVIVTLQMFLEDILKYTIEHFDP